MSILIVYFSLKGLVSLFTFIQLDWYFIISLGVFYILFDHYIEQNICFYQFRSSLWEIF